MREIEGITSENHPDEFEKETPKNVTDSDFDSAYKVIWCIKYWRSILIRNVFSLLVVKNSVIIFLKFF